MCGIVGISNFQNKSKVNEPLLVKMRDEMIHRGPDDCGLWISDDGFTGLAHRRLSIIDVYGYDINSESMRRAQEKIGLKTTTSFRNFFLCSPH